MGLLPVRQLLGVCRKPGTSCAGVTAFMKEHLTELIFILYLLFCMLSNWLVELFFGRNSRAGLPLYLLVAAAFFCLTVPKLHAGISRMELKGPGERLSLRQRLCVAGGFAVFTLLVLLVPYAADCPGGFDGDPMQQIEQAFTGVYSDWHPVWHTLLFFTLPVKLTGTADAVVLLQILYFSVTAGYTGLVAFRYGGFRFAAVAAAFVILNPFTLGIVMIPWKDVAFAMTAALCTAFTARIYFSGGSWCGKRRNIFLLSFMLVSATLFRHNGILFTFPLLVVLAFQVPKRRYVLLCTLCALLFCIIRGPLYSCLHVSKPGDRTLETMGLPLSVIFHAATQCPERLDEETLDFVDEVVFHKPELRAFFNLNGFNSVKYHVVNTAVIEEAGPGRVLAMMAGCFARAPGQSILAVFGLTRCVYAFEYGISTGPVTIPPNQYGLVCRGNRRLGKIVNEYAGLMYKSFFRYFISVGASIVLMLAFILFRGDFCSRSGWKRIVLCLPIFTYDFGTMLLLTGHDVRFFFVSFLVCPLVILLMTGSRSPQQSSVTAA